MRYRNAWFATILAAAWAAPSPVAAKCRVPGLELLWSYPADGAIDVPTNATFWALTPYSWGPPAATLNGIPVSASMEEGASGSVSGSLGALQPQHDYVLRLDYGKSHPSEDAGVPTLIEIAFRTGAGPAEQLAATPVGGEATVDELSGVRCPEILRAQECLDTGPNTLLTFETAEPRAIGWLVDGRAMPARCGPPAAYVRFWQAPRCFDIRSIGPGGLTSPETRYCSQVSGADALPATEDEVAPAPGANDAGCSLVDASARTGLPWPWFILAAVLARRGRSRRAQHGRQSLNTPAGPGPEESLQHWPVGQSLSQ